MKKFGSLMVMMSIVLSLSACTKSTPVETNSVIPEASAVIPETNNVVPEDEEQNQYPLTITNYNYSKEKIPVTFEKIPEKVFCLYQNSIETMLALGLEDHILAAAKLDHPVKPEYAEAFSKINYISDFELTKEAVIMMQPDFILTWMSPFDEKKLGDVDFWHERSINTYMAPNSNSLEPNKTLENEYRYIMELGEIFDVEDRAQEIVNEVKSEVNRVTEATKGQEKRTAMIIEFGKDSMFTYGKTTLGGNMVTALGGELLEGAESTIGLEDLINLNPDVIYVVYMDGTEEGKELAAINKVLENDALASLTAVKNGSVYGMPLGNMYAAATRMIDGINIFAKGMYPELY